MSLRYDVDFNRRAREAHERQRWAGFVRTLWGTAFFGGLLALSLLYALLVQERHREVARLARERQRQVAVAGIKPVLIAPALEMVMSAKASPEMWADRLERLGRTMPNDGQLTEFEGGATAKEAESPTRTGVMQISGRFPVSGSMTGPLTQWIDALHADTAFSRGVTEIRLESSHIMSDVSQRHVEFRIVAR